MLFFASCKFFEVQKSLNSCKKFICGPILKRFSPFFMFFHGDLYNINKDQITTLSKFSLEYLIEGTDPDPSALTISPKIFQGHGLFFQSCACAVPRYRATYLGGIESNKEPCLCWTLHYTGHTDVDLDLSFV